MHSCVTHLGQFCLELKGDFAVHFACRGLGCNLDHQIPVKGGAKHGIDHSPVNEECREPTFTILTMDRLSLAAPLCAG